MKEIYSLFSPEWSKDLSHQPTQPDPAGCAEGRPGINRC